MRLLRRDRSILRAKSGATLLFCEMLDSKCVPGRSSDWPDWSVPDVQNLAQAVFGVAPPDSGTVEIDGRSGPDSLGLKMPLHLEIAYAPEDRQRQGLVIAMTVGQNIGLTEFGRLMRGPFLDFQAEDKLAKEYIEIVADQNSNKSSARSQSFRRQSAENCHLGKWLATKPRLLIVDEPTRGIDVGARAEIHRLLDRLAREDNMAILVISSDLPEVLRLSDRICVMREGRLVAEFNRQQCNSGKYRCCCESDSNQTATPTRTTSGH